MFPCDIVRGCVGSDSEHRLSVSVVIRWCFLFIGPVLGSVALVCGYVGTVVTRLGRENWEREGLGMLTIRVPVTGADKRNGSKP